MEGNSNTREKGKQGIKVTSYQASRGKLGNHEQNQGYRKQTLNAQREGLYEGNDGCTA